MSAILFHTGRGGGIGKAWASRAGNRSVAGQDKPMTYKIDAFPFLA